jgi:hypothetical protein
MPPTKSKPIILDASSKLEQFKKCDIFTPDTITKLMTLKLNQSGTLLEPSVGVGNLLKYINTSSYDTVDVYEIKKEYLDEITISNVNKYNCDFLKESTDTTYDNIIMNPPYIKIQDLSSEYRDYLKESFAILNNGMVDIYYAFIIKCLTLLSSNGTMVSITPNSYLYNKSSLQLRKYLFDNKYVTEIIDFKEKKVFKEASVYCCITIFKKDNEQNYLLYNDKKILYTDILKNYSLFNFNTTNNGYLKDICKIRNGIATLRDKIFIHSSKLFDELCWREITNGARKKYIIYPYTDSVIIDEPTFKKTNPETYNYLCQHKEELKKRDKGKKIYPAWYAYGRTQSINNSKKKCLYVPCFINPELIEKNIFKHTDILHHSCLCIEPNNEENIDSIISCIINNIEFIKNNSSKRGGGWINMSSRVLYDIPLQ